MRGQAPNPYFELHRELASLAPEMRLGLRKKLIWAYSWAVPSPEAIEALAAYSPIVELGAGTGYWAWLLSLAGARVQAFDLNAPSPPQWLQTRPISQYVAREHGDATLLLCWPPLGEPMAFDALMSFEGRRVAYVGEWRGRTGDAGFHDLLERDFKRVHEVAIPRWPGFEDSLYIYERKPRGT